MPPTAGFPVNEEERYFLLQFHYDNRKEQAGVVDNSSAVRFHFTDTPRLHDAGTLQMGDGLLSLTGKEVESDRPYTFSCPAECTAQMAQPAVTVYASMLHAHRLGRRLWTNIYRNGTFIKTMEGSAYWSDGHQRNSLVHGATTLLPGDELRTTCTYGAAKATAAANGTVPRFGLQGDEEMCLSFLFLYPRLTRAAPAAAAVGAAAAADGGGGGGGPDRITTCAPAPLDDAGTVGTLCGGLADVKIPRPRPPPAFLPVDGRGRADAEGMRGDPFGGVSACAAPPACA